MKKILKKTGKILLIVLGVFIVFMIGLFIFNKVMIKKEAPLVARPIGQMVEVDGNEMCVYTEGEGEHR